MATKDKLVTLEDLNELKKYNDSEVSDLKSDLSGILTGNETAFPLNTTWSQGGVNNEGEYSSWSRIRTDYISINGIGQITVIPAEGYAAAVVLYDNNKQYIRFTLWSTTNTVVKLADNEVYMRLNLRKNPEANLSPSAGVNLSATAVFKISSDVASANNAINKMTPVSIDSFLQWSIGGIADGVNTNVNTRIRTDYVDVSDYSVLDVSCNTGYKYNVTLYDATKTYLFAVPIAAFSTEQNRIIIRDASYIRFSMATANDATLSNVSISSNLTCTVYNSLVGDTLINTSNRVDISSGVTWVRGVLDENGDFAESTSRVVTDDYIDVSEYQSICIYALSNAVKYGVFWFGDSGKISMSNAMLGINDIEVPPNATKAKVILEANPDAWMGNANISKSIRIYVGKIAQNNCDGNDLIRNYFVSTCVNKKEIPVLETGKTILTIGDSITAAEGETGWTYHIAQMTGVTVINKAIGGSTFGESVSDQTHRISNQIATVSSSEWSEVDLVIVAAGTNDYQHETPLDELKEKVQSAVTAIKAKTNAPIVFITPIRRGFGINQDPIIKIAMIGGIISNVALANQCNVICGYDFPIPTYNIDGLIDNMTRDSLHPIATGANVYARSVINAMV